ncbi:uncharacterized protein CC84DRAFT_1181269 [Paraphaeosphaeria sporulosa]|uniref:Uncharacterized protein n=1 Tax=Paraphaeosphaeria sporulosa TaxID=1460663 RepID=A0A177BXF2_9PLEO|nr:uncharacterized protein CC84DRAFT_1181269 [Paraphaeosphaeria sporulosa]OAF99815.1 hypothetical protein CC84DRAFT_1181269 [Paraphaeosphaeria sporulosa]
MATPKRVGQMLPNETCSDWMSNFLRKLPVSQRSVFFSNTKRSQVVDLAEIVMGCLLSDIRQALSALTPSAHVPVSIYNGDLSVDEPEREIQASRRYQRVPRGKSPPAPSHCPYRGFLELRSASKGDKSHKRRLAYHEKQVRQKILQWHSLSIAGLHSAAGWF